VAWKELKFVAVEAAEYHSLALTADGDVYIWGDGISGQLADPVILGHSRPVPYLLERLQGNRIVQVSSGSYHLAALKITNCLFGELTRPATWYSQRGTCRCIQSPEKSPTYLRAHRSDKFFARYSITSYLRYLVDSLAFA
jgi:alpha-tubulin suppressor-like RCC1 family protein